MQVICINNSYYPVSLSLNKKYNVLREEGLFYIIVDESYEEYLFPKELFKVIENEAE